MLAYKSRKILSQNSNFDLCTKGGRFLKSTYLFPQIARVFLNNKELIKVF